MVFDLVSAFSLACNVLQVVETGAKVLSKAAEYRSASDGMLDEQRDLRNTALTGGRLIVELEQSLESISGAQDISAAEQRLIECNRECLRLSISFVDLLNRWKVKDSPAFTETLRKSIKSAWNKDKVVAMERNLCRARDNLTLAFLVYSNSKHGDNATQEDILKSNSALEARLIQEVSNSSDVLQDKVGDLAVQLNNISLDSVHAALATFSSQHQASLNHLSRQLDEICRMHNAIDAQNESAHAQEVHRKLVDSLYFQEILYRRDHIQPAYQHTYGWVLDPSTAPEARWDDFIAWLRDPQPLSNTYWITAKPGAGKSSLVRFLDKSLGSDEHMQPWAGQTRIVQIQSYFWNPGSALQKSLTGFLRTILYQLANEFADLFDACVNPRKRRLLQTQHVSSIAWTDPELRELLANLTKSTSSSTKILFLIDGLDEIDGGRDAIDQLLEIIGELSGLSHVKMCVSSRPWPVFGDAFIGSPQMRLEDLNRPDIATFVRGRIRSQRRYQQMLLSDSSKAEQLVSDVIDKAEGVFLWTKLVVNELLRGLTDGDSDQELLQKLEGIPSDLNLYFKRLLDSIEPKHRPEACAVLRLALGADCPGDITLFLMDFIFLDDAQTDFALTSHSERYIDIFNDTERLIYTLESTLRKLSSRCKGLLECSYSKENGSNSYAAESFHAITALPNVMKADLHTNRDLAFDFRVGFMHRSLRDYLLESTCQDFLHRHSEAQFDPLNYLRNADLTELSMLMTMDAVPRVAMGVAEACVRSLSIPDFRDDPRCAGFVGKLELAEKLFNHRPSADERHRDYLIDLSLLAWPREGGNFLSLAIDFALTGYVAQVLTEDAVASQTGRPLLDYSLRPRFAAEYWDPAEVGNRFPVPELVQLLLDKGADPNAQYEGVSIWPLFLSFIADISAHPDQGFGPERCWGLSVKAMIEGGAGTVVSGSDLSVQHNHGIAKGWGYWLRHSQADSHPADRWRILVPGYERAAWMQSNIRVVDIFGYLKPVLGDDVDGLIALAESRGERSPGRILPEEQ